MIKEKIYKQVPYSGLPHLVTQVFKIRSPFPVAVRGNKTIEEWSKRCKVVGFKDRERELQARECGRSLELKMARKVFFSP